MTSTAKLFMHGRSQAVRLPKEFRFEGTEVRVSKVGDKVILEPLKKEPFDAEAWFARLDELGARDFSPTVFLTIRRSNPIRESSSTNDLPRHQHRDFAPGIAVLPFDAEAADAARLRQSISRPPSRAAWCRKTPPTSPPACCWRD
jgi:antitoxin VapB